MHNIKDIRNNSDNFKEQIKSRNVDIKINEILELDSKNRNLIHEKETLEKEKKNISKTRDKSLFSKSKEISAKLESIVKNQNQVKNQQRKLLIL